MSNARRWGWLAWVLGSTWLAVPASASPPESLAVFPVRGEGRAASRVARRVAAELVRVATARKVTVLSGGELRRALGANPSRALAACNAEIACIAELGERAGVEAVFTADTYPLGPETQVFGVVVSTRNRAVLYTLALTFPSPRAVTRDLPAELRTWMDAEPPDPNTQVADNSPDGAAAPVHEPASSPAGEAVAARDETAATTTTDGVSTAATEQPDNTGTEMASGASNDGPPANPRPVSDAEVVDAAFAIHTAPPVEPELSLDRTAQPAEASWSGWSTAGIVGMGVGLVVAGVGAYFGAQSTGADIRRDGRSQLDMLADAERANANAATANTLFAAGGATAAVGAALLVTGLLADVD